MHGVPIRSVSSFRYDNDLLDSTLTKFDFVFPDAPVSTSNYTLIIMASMVQYDAIAFTNKKTNINFHEMYKARMSIERNVVVPFLQSNGYDII